MRDRVSGGVEATEVLFTVFTPTFNRADRLVRVWRSLCAQTLSDFEWLIVDDGSTDETRSVVEAWAARAPFPVRYVYRPNGGKHAAFNTGVGEAKGRLFLPFDSDDECVPEALKVFANEWEALENDTRFSGISACCVDQHGVHVGERLAVERLDSNPAELYYRYGHRGEKWGFHRTEVLRRFLFADFRKSEGFRYVPESVVWFAISKEYQTRYLARALRVYWREDDSASLMRGTKSWKDSRGAVEQHLQALNLCWRWARVAPVEFLKHALHYARFSIHSGIGLHEQRRRLEHPTTVGLWLVMLPLARVVVACDNWRTRR